MPILTERQLIILKAIIDEYIETAEPVGSETLEKKYDLDVSPATIRNEMVRLTKAGYLKQPHTSAGRAPTPYALKYYVENLMKPKELSVAEEVKVKQKIWDYRTEMGKLLREATRALARQTGVLSIAATDERDIFTSGLGNILDMPEFYDIDVTKNLLDALDEYDYWWGIFSSIEKKPETLIVLLGEDLHRKLLHKCGGVFIRFLSPTHKGIIGVIGPYRLNYPRIIPAVEYMGDLINEIALNW